MHALNMVSPQMLQILSVSSLVCRRGTPNKFAHLARTGDLEEQLTLNPVKGETW